MAGHFFFARGREQFGPFSAAQMKDLAADGKVERTDTVWREGTSKVVLAAKVKDLFAAGKAAAAPADVFVPIVELSRSSPQPTANHSSQTIMPAVGAESSPSSVATQVPLPEPVAEAISPVAKPKMMPPQNNPEPCPERSAGQSLQEKGAPRQTPFPLRKDPIQKRRAVAGKGAVILHQDGVVVHYKKKCSQCGYEDINRSSMQIKSGWSRVGFFCPRCKKQREVEIRG